MELSIKKLGFVAALLAGGCGQAVSSDPAAADPTLPDGVERISGPLLGDPNFGYWGSRTDAKPPIINVCFENPTDADATYRTWVRDAVERTWNRYARVSFSGWGQCQTTSVEPGIHVLLGTAMQLGPDGRVVPLIGSDGKAHVGKFALNGRRASLSPQQGLWLNPNVTEARGRNVAVHEFGHALGFWHEESRPGVVNQCMNGDGTINGNTFGPYDTTSIMSYCGGMSGGAMRLSANDIASVQHVYGRKILGDIVSPHGNCVEASGWTTGMTGVASYLSTCDEYWANQTWKWQWQASPNLISLSNNPASDPSHTEALEMMSFVDGTYLEMRDLRAQSYMWQLSNVELRGFGAKCLTYPGTVGAPLTMQDCSSRAASPSRNGNQRWDRFDPNGYLRLTGTNICVSIQNKAGTLPGQKLITATCNVNDTAQQFFFGADAPQISNIKYRANTSYCFDVMGATDAQFTGGTAGPVDGVNIQLAACSTSTPSLTQDWNATGQLQALGKCMDRYNGGDVAFSTYMWTYTCTPATSGDWVTNSAGQEWDLYWK